MTAQKTTIDEIAKQLKEILGDSLLEPAYGMNNYNNSIRDSILQLCGKCNYDK